jgi:hypothetical protein
MRNTDGVDLCRRAMPELIQLFEKNIGRMQWESLPQPDRFNSVEVHPFMEKNMAHIGFPLMCAHPHK